MRAHIVLISIIASAVVGVLASGAPGAITISDVMVVNGKYYLNGADQNDYGYDLSVDGTGITSVTVAGPNSTSFTLNNDGDSWNAESWPHFSTEAALRAAFPVGDYTFNFNGGAASSKVNFAGTAPGGIATGLTPPDGSTGVSTTPTFTWSAVPSDYGIGIHADVRDVFLDHTVAETFPPLSMSATSWPCPVTLDTGEQYELDLEVAQGSISSDTIDGTSFPIYSVYIYGNAVDFTTTPEPASLALLAAGGLGILARLRARR